ncbi:hypothetical protein ACFQV2_06015 [Actinokineospora soli]|uniref:Uncharacterized protein n=1 Tax=Actinokineospora soli TaxID=1048753 RepID=A0ABW2TJB3_9PSEU
MSRTATGVLVLAVVVTVVSVVVLLVLLDMRNDRKKAQAAVSKHEGGEHGHVLTVAVLLERAARSGRALRLNWSVDDTEPHGLAAVQPGDDWPTGVLPRVHCEGDQ